MQMNFEKGDYVEITSKIVEEPNSFLAFSYSDQLFKGKKLKDCSRNDLVGLRGILVDLNRDEAEIICLSEDSAFSISLPLRQLQLINKGKERAAFFTRCALEEFHEKLEEKRMNAYAEEKLSKVDTTAYRSSYVEEEYETITTTGRPEENPIRPNGSGWRLVSSAAVNSSSIYCYVCWYWERRKNG